MILLHVPKYDVFLSQMLFFLKLRCHFVQRWINQQLSICNYYYYYYYKVNFRSFVAVFENDGPTNATHSYDVNFSQYLRMLFL